MSVYYETIIIIEIFVSVSFILQQNVFKKSNGLTSTIFVGYHSFFTASLNS